MFSKLLVRSSARATAVVARRITPSVVFRPVSIVGRSLATKSAPKGAGAPVPAAVKTAVSPVVKLAAVKTELATLLANEFNESGGAMDENHPYAQYVKENGLEITANKPDDQIIIKKSIHGYK